MSTTRAKGYDLRAGRGDEGHSGQPGQGISEVSVTLYTTGPRKWKAVAEVKYGTNQGYDSWHSEYGPWTGVGSTPAAAVDQCLARADAEHRANLRRASIVALNEADGKTYASLAAAEADRIQSVLDRGEPDGCTHAVIAGSRVHRGTREGRDESRREAVASLRRIAGRGPSPLAAIDDADLIAECRRRGLTI